MTDISFGSPFVSELLQQEHVSEVLILGFDRIFVERFGEIERSPHRFHCELDFENWLQELLNASQTVLHLACPYVSLTLGPYRIQVALESGDYSKKTLSIRVPTQTDASLVGLSERGWCGPHGLLTLKTSIATKQNILFVGGTSSGKTTALSACLKELSENTRVLALEDAAEIKLPNACSSRLVTYQRKVDSGVEFQDIGFDQLIRHALRMRPDRLVLGEIRGVEAKDFLLALSTGHAGSMSSIHAGSAEEALLRLEMLIQMGAPQWSLSSIRKLMFLSIHILVFLKKTEERARRVESIHRVASLEPDVGLLLEPLYCAANEGSMARLSL